MSSVAHPLALVETDDIGAGTRICAYAHVMAGARIGGGCSLGEGVFIESGVVIGNDVTVKNGVAVYDKVTVEDEAFLGPHCVFTNDLRPRSGRFKHSPENFLPARLVGLVCACGRALPSSLICTCDLEFDPQSLGVRPMSRKAGQ